LGLDSYSELKPEECNLMYPYIVERIFGYTPEEVDIILEGDFMMDISDDQLE